MAYSFQTFAANQVFTEGQANQIEVNIRDHRHGQNSVAPVQLSWEQTAKTATFDVLRTDNGKFFRAGSGGTTDVVARLLDVSSAGEQFAFGVLNDNDLQLNVGSEGQTGVVLVNSSVAQPITPAGFRDWPVTPGEAGYFIQSSGHWYPYGFSGLHPIAHVLQQSTAIGSHIRAYIPAGYNAVLAIPRTSNTKNSDELNLRTRRASQSSGSYDDEIVHLCSTVDTLITGPALAAVGIFNLQKQDGAQSPFTVLFTGQATLETVTAAGSADNSPVVEIMVQNSGGTSLATGSFMDVYGLKRYITI